MKVLRQNRVEKNNIFFVVFLGVETTRRKEEKGTHTLHSSQPGLDLQS